MWAAQALSAVLNWIYVNEACLNLDLFILHLEELLNTNGYNGVWWWDKKLWNLTE